MSAETVHRIDEIVVTCVECLESHIIQGSRIVEASNRATAHYGETNHTKFNYQITTRSLMRIEIGK